MTVLWLINHSKRAGKSTQLTRVGSVVGSKYVVRWPRSFEGGDEWGSGPVAQSLIIINTQSLIFRSIK